MENNDSNNNRFSEIITFYYAVMTHRIRSGMKPGDARAEAFDAVQLRYGIGQRRMANIISEQKGLKMQNPRVMRTRTEMLVEELERVNDGLQKTIDKNSRLAELLRGFLADEG